jgi:hypothetical protein
MASPAVPAVCSQVSSQQIQDAFWANDESGLQMLKWVQ